MATLRKETKKTGGGASEESLPEELDEWEEMIRSIIPPEQLEGELIVHVMEIP